MKQFFYFYPTAAMSNSYFSFKQFSVQQDKSAMKVCTDACIFGAWVSNNAAVSPASQVLDLGTGTGLLSLMYAQKNSTTQIDAIEIDPSAATQANENFKSSPWKERLQIIQADATCYEYTHTYDLILSNPPFFENDLKSKKAGRNLALHSEALNLEDLLSIISRQINPAGKFAILLPWHRSAYFENLCRSKGFFPADKLSVRQTPRHPFFRSMLLFSTERASVQESEIIIQNSPGIYSSEFTHLLKDYYLAF